MVRARREPLGSPLSFRADPERVGRAFRRVGAGRAGGYSYEVAGGGLAPGLGRRTRRGGRGRPGPRHAAPDPEVVGAPLRGRARANAIASERRQESERVQRDNFAQRLVHDGEEQGEDFASLSVEGFHFRVTLTSSRRWRNFRTDRRVYRTVLESVDEVRGRDPHSHLLENFRATEALEQMFKELLSRVRQDHLRAGRPRSALVSLSVSADGLEYPVVTDLAPLFGDKSVVQLLEMSKKALQSNKEVSLEGGFEVDITVIDDEHQPGLIYAAGGDEAFWSKKVPAAWKELGLSSKKFIKLMPVVGEEDPEFANCCLLAGIAYCMLYNESQRHALVGDPREKAFEPLTRICHQVTTASGASRREKATRMLRTEMSRLKRTRGLDLEHFRNCAVPSEGLKRQVDKLSINLVLYRDSSNFGPVFQWPETYDPARECVHVLLMRLEGDRYHAASITRPKNYGSDFLKQGSYCPRCKKMFTQRYAQSHACSGAEVCGSCRRVKLKAGMYLDKQVSRSLCRPVQGQRRRCSRCRKDFVSNSCYTAHNLFCRSGTTVCMVCGALYNFRKSEHRCGYRTCRQCEKSYAPDDRVEGGHFCQLKRPKAQKKYEKMCFIDTETVAEGPEKVHRVNAVGLSYESTRGRFDDVYFYDSGLRMEESGKVRKNAYYYKYWPRHLDGEVERWEVEPPVSLKSASFVRSPRRGAAAGGDGGFEPSFSLSSAGEGRKEPRKPMDPDFEPSPAGSAMGDFMDFILSERFYNTVFLAHASSRFDSILILQELMARKVRVEPVFDGNKLLQLKVPALKMRFIDSHRYIRMPLSGFTKRFPSLEDEDLEKGVFPFLMNRPEFYGYRGAFPPKEMFLDAYHTEKSLKAYERFRDSWHEDLPYDFKEQLHKYLQSDVRVLRGGCLRLAEELFGLQEELAEANRCSGPSFFHPYTNYFTCSSFVHAIFLHFEVEDDTLFLLTNERNARKTSNKERMWLDYLVGCEGRTIRTEFNQLGGQARLGKYFPDGTELLAGGRKRALEMFGCVVHYHAGMGGDEASSCPYSSGFLPSDKGIFGGTMEQQSLAVKRKLDYYKRHKIECEYIWECQFDKRVRDDHHFRDFMRRLKYPEERLRLRSGLKGGRTETLRMLYTASPGRVLRYYDKNSIYPHSAIQNRFPVGQPEKIVGEGMAKVRACRSRGFYREGPEGPEPLLGLVQATVLAPDSLFLPILPAVSNGKLKFGLCAACMEEMLPGPCKHPPQQRALTGVWTSAELLFAEECGYKIVKMHEMFAYTRQEYLFRRFFTKLARTKLESEGFPAGVETEEEKAAHVEQINKLMPGLGLEVQNVRRNEGRRRFAKDVSNISLGKFSQSDVRRNVEYVYSFEEFVSLRHSRPDIVVRNMFPLTEHMAEVSYEPNEQALGFNRSTNSVIYSFVTAYSRISMMRDMRWLMSVGARLFYTDTDSIFFDVEDKPEVLGKVDEMLSVGSTAYGAYKSETKSDVVSFASLGAKNYSYCCADGELVVKSRGFTLDSLVSKGVINHEVMMDMLLQYLNGVESKVKCTSFKMSVDRKKAMVKNGTVEKVYSNSVFDKRVVMALHPDIFEEVGDDTACTLPFGLRHYEFADCEKSSVF